MDTPPKVKAFYKEFPFLENVFPKKKTTDVKVRRADKALLEEIGGLIWEPDDVSIFVNEYFLLDRNGAKLGLVGQYWLIKNPDRKWYQIWKPLHIESSTDAPKDESRFHPQKVSQAISALKNPNDVHYIVKVEVRNGPKWRAPLTLYKPPKDFSLLSWLNEEESREQAALKQQLAAIDAQA